MRKILATAIMAAASVALLATPATATSAGGAKPHLRIVSFSPQTGANGSESQLTVNAVDRDGVIWEVQVRWGDGSVTWATTGCVQGHKPGTRAHLIIPHTYIAPGRYRIRAEASSLQRCPLDGPGGVEQHSRAKVKAVVITHGGAVPRY